MIIITYAMHVDFLGKQSMLMTSFFSSSLIQKTYKNKPHLDNFCFATNVFQFNHKELPAQTIRSSQNLSRTDNLMNSAQFQDQKTVIEIFRHILIRKKINFPPQRVIQLLHDKYVKQALYQFNKDDSVSFDQSKVIQPIVTIIDLSDQFYDKSRPQSQKNSSQMISQDKIIIIEQTEIENLPLLPKKSIEFPRKIIQKQTERAFYLLEDPFTPKNYQESLVQNYIDFRNIKFSDTMPVSRAQQRKSQNHKKNIQQKFTHSKDTSSDQNSKKWKKVGISLQSQPLWKDRIKPDHSYMSSLAEVWTLEEDCMTRKKQLIKIFHEQRQAAQLLINLGYGIKNVGHKLELFNDKKTYHKIAYAIVKQAFRCIENDLIEKEKKTIKPLTLANFRKVMCFLAHYHDSFKEDEQKKQNFSQYIKIAYLIKTDPPNFQQTFSLYNFILKGVLSQADSDGNIINLD